MVDSSHIRTLAEGELITEPGFYAIPLSQHHNQPCDGVSVTSGILRTMELKTPMDVWAFHALNPFRYVRDRSDTFRFGAAMAAWVEGGEPALREQFAVLPADKPNKPTAAQIKAYDEGRGTEAGIKSISFWSRVADDPRDYITHEEWETLCHMGRVLESDPAAAAALGGVPEITAAWFDEINDLWVLARPDLTNFGGFVSDYKTAADRGYGFDVRSCDRSITQYGYDMQLGLAAEAYERLTGDWPELAAVVFQLKAPPFHVIARAIEDEDLRIATFRNRRARARFRECLDSGDWPGPGAHFAAYSRPDWLREQLIEEMNTAGEAP